MSAGQSVISLMGGMGYGNFNIDTGAGVRCRQTQCSRA